LGVPPFHEIGASHFLPAFREAILHQRAEVDAIAGCAQPPTFANTVEALDAAGTLLAKVTRVFHGLTAAETSDQLQDVSREAAPLLSSAHDDIRMDGALFGRIQTVWDERERLTLAPAERKLLDDTYRSFVRGGASLDRGRQERLRSVNAEIATLGVTFADNLLHETNAFQLVIDDSTDLSGLPDAVIVAAAEAAAQAGLAGRWLFTLHAPSLWPFLQYADDRELRREILAAYTSRCRHGDQYDNTKDVARVAALRAEKAALLGYKTFADLQLDECMAKTPDRVLALLARLWTPARSSALGEAAELQQLIREEGGSFGLETWDWRYYAERVRRLRYNLDEQALRPYFRLENVRDGAFRVATRLFGVTFVPRPDLPVYHADVETFEVRDDDGSPLGALYLDFHPRPSKSVGAWTDIFRERDVDRGRATPTVAAIVCNFPRPAGGLPALLGLEDV
jgi:peptidyl-dipeptidase Dcp